MAEAIIIVNNGQPTTVVGAESEEAAAEETYSFSEMERYTDDEDLPAYGESLELEAEFSSEGSVVGVHEKENSGGDAQEKKYNGPDGSKLADKNAPAVVKRKNSILSPKSSMLSKLKPFSPKVSTRSQSSSNRKPSHFFSEPSPKSKPSSKVKGMNVLSPRAPPTPKTKSPHPPVVPSPKVQGEKLSSPREAPLPKESSVADEIQADEEQVSLAVAPGRLGISLKIDKQRGGAKIVSIDSLSEFHGQVDVGDRIVGIDDRKVRNLNDFKVDSDKKRNFIICRKEKESGQGSNEVVETEPHDLDDPQTTRVTSLKADMTHKIEENKGLFATLLGKKEDAVTVPHDLDDPQTTRVEALKADVPHEIEENRGLSATFNFTSNRYNCATTVSSDSTSSTITTLLKPVTSCMECGHSHAIDKFGIAAESIEDLDPEQMNSKVPSTAQISQLQISDHAFIKRSNGEWTYSEIIDKGRGSITFAVDNFGNGKTITKRRWKSSIRLVANDENSFESESILEDDDSISSVDDYSYESVVEEYSTCSSSSGSEYSSEDESYISSPAKSPSSAADKKKQLKKMVDKKKMDLKAKKQEKKRQAKLAAAEAKRKERELKEAHELQVKLRLMHLEELKLEEEEEAEKERQRIKEEKTAKKLSDREEKKRMKVAKKVAEKEEMKRKKIDEQNDWKRVALLAKSEKEAKVQMKKLQKAKKQAAALEAKRQAELMFKGLEASVASPVAGKAADVSAVANEVDAFVNDFFLCEM